MRVEKVTTIDEALSRLEEYGNEAQVLAGGTDVMIQLARGEISPEVLIPIHALEELSHLRINGGAMIGALVTLEEIASGSAGAEFAALAEAAATVGGWQTQTIGTLVGNICNASPAADTVPPLLVRNAEVHLQSVTKDRVLPLSEFVIGRRTTARRSDELVTGIHLPAPRSRSGDVYLKVGRRGAMEVAIVGLAMCLAFDDDGTVTSAQIAVASVGAVPVRPVRAESLLEGKRPNQEVLASAAEAILDDISPIDDLRGSARYRQQLIPGLTRRAAQRCIERAGVAASLEELDK